MKIEVLDMVVNGLCVLETDDIKMIDFNKEKFEIYILTEHGDYTLNINKGIPLENKERCEIVMKETSTS